MKQLSEARKVRSSTKSPKSSSSKRSTPQYPWELDAKYLKGVGPKLAGLLSKVEIKSFWDLLFHLPRKYEDRRKFFSFEEMLSSVDTGSPVLSQGVIEAYVPKRSANGRSWLEAEVLLNQELSKGGQQRVCFVWFHKYAQQFKRQFPVGTPVVFQGKLQSFRGRLQMSHPTMQKTDQQLPAWEFGSFIPVYSESMGISTRVFRRILYQAQRRPELANVPESLPAEMVQRLGLMTLPESLRELHFPRSWEPVDEESVTQTPYFRRLAFEELFFVSLALGIRKQVYREERERNEELVPSLEVDRPTLDSWKDSLPFDLTEDQEKSLSEVLSDMSAKQKSGPMHRLLQGDVGSGKTVVAFLSMLVALKNGYQAALMAPTEILADQHFRNFQKLFPEYMSEMRLLKGALSEKKKKEIRAGLSKGEGRLIIGTQALLAGGDFFDRLGLVVIDEQHRFGVKQRLSLKKQNQQCLPHFLVMTATPIPRSLALTLYGDLKLSQIRSKPSGRSPVKTHVIKESAKKSLVNRLAQFLDEGRQIYLVYPLVEENEELELKDVQTAFAEWSKAFPKKKVSLLHGKMKSAEKEGVMRSFQSGECDVLVSTTVIEVGVDVPNASVIVVEHAERFGLSQLHQLRGRVGRGATQSYCVLVSSNRVSENARERLKVMEESEDGFYISEKDLELRGPGEFLGQRQSGLPGFRIAHILRDVELLELARKEAYKILDQDPILSSASNADLRKHLMRWWGSRLELGLSG